MLLSWTFYILSTIVGHCNATVILEEENTLSRTVAQTTANSSTSKPYQRSYCTESLEASVLDLQDCTAAFIDLSQDPIARQNIVWGNPNPLDPGHLPWRTVVGNCQLSLRATSEVNPGAWIMDAYDHVIVELLYDCVRDGSHRGGFTLIGPDGHQILTLITEARYRDGGGNPSNVMDAKTA